MISPRPSLVAVSFAPKPALTLASLLLIFTNLVKSISPVRIDAPVAVAPAATSPIAFSLTFLPTPILAARMLTAFTALTLPNTLIVPLALMGIWAKPSSLIILLN